MENEKNKRAGIGQKPRGRQQTRGVEALPSEKPVASNEGQEEGVKDPVSEPADRVQEGGGLLEEISTISDKTAEKEKMSSVAVFEADKSLEEMLAKSVHEDGKAVAIGTDLSVSGGKEIAPRIIFRSSEFTDADREMLEDLPPGKITVVDMLGQQLDGSFRVAVRLEEGYIEPVRQWAEAEGITVEEWCSRQLSHYLETWGQPAKSR